jgi:hypothetical protein
MERDLPVGLQITGEEDDPTTIEFARPLATEIDGFVPAARLPLSSGLVNGADAPKAAISVQAGSSWQSRAAPAQREMRTAAGEPGQ